MAKVHGPGSTPSHRTTSSEQQKTHGVAEFKLDCVHVCTYVCVCLCVCSPKRKSHAERLIFNFLAVVPTAHNQLWSVKDRNCIHATLDDRWLDTMPLNVGTQGRVAASLSWSQYSKRGFTHFAIGSVLVHRMEPNRPIANHSVSHLIAHHSQEVRFLQAKCTVSICETWVICIPALSSQLPSSYAHRHSHGSCME